MYNLGEKGFFRLSENAQNFLYLTDSIYFV
jgi:hypothetical protein